MEIAKLQVTGTKARIISRRQVPTGLIGGFITIEYADPLWHDLMKTVVFRSTAAEKIHTTRDVVTDETLVKIPVETTRTAGRRLYVGFYGTDQAGNVAIPTIWADLGTIMEAAAPSGDESVDPSLPVWAQLAERIKELEQNGSGSGGVGPQGPAGPQGEPGYTPVRGVDYWTEGDKAGLVVDVLNALPVWEGGSY